MTVPIECIRPGAVFRLKTAPRRVVSRTGSGVEWEYADGRRRGGRLAGSQWISNFRRGAIEEIPDPGPWGAGRKLLSGRVVPSIAGLVEITLTTHCPRKWAMVDMESGHIWGHDGNSFRRLERADVEDVMRAAQRAGEYLDV